MNKLLDTLTSIPGKVYLLLATTIFAASGAVTRQLINLGEQNLIDGRNPISFCNVLVVGNLCALIVLILVYKNQINLTIFKRLNSQDWLGLIIVGILSGALAPALLFTALDLTSVNNVILIGRVEPPLTLALSVFLLRDRINLWVTLGSSLSFLGVLITILLQKSGENMITMGGGLDIGQGELYAVLGSVVVAIANILSRVSLRQISLGIFTIIRTILGTIIFFVIVIKLYGAIHFMDVFSPVLWQWMLIYGSIIVVGGQLCWFMGLKSTKASDVSLANSFSPLVGILAAYFILGEVPNMAQYIGGIVIILGIIFNQIGVNKLNHQRLLTLTEKEADIETGFKGI
ncbi:MAG TPA: EamA family transporter [Cyanothece sp. UBA12306]|nr:EamA family transporter [Cyanothece sp. UBA12306]